MSSLQSHLVEKTFSQSTSQIMIRSFRTVEDEIVARINMYRLKISLVRDKIEDLLNENSNLQDNVIVMKDINKTIKFQSQEDIDRLRHYIASLSEMKMTIPDFSNGPFINNLFSKTFGPYIENNKGLLNKDQEIVEQLRRKIPSRNYQGLYIHDIDVTTNIDSLILFAILEEFFILNAGLEQLASENIQIELFNKEIPQQISLLNPDFNTVAVFLGEGKKSIYILFLTDILELMAPDSPDIFMSRAETVNHLKKGKHDFGKSTLSTKLRIPAKYEHIKHTKPDVNLELCHKFVAALDTDNDDKISKADVLALIKKHFIAIEESTVDEMFDDIWKRRNVKVESQRCTPITEDELYHAIRYTYKRDHETQDWYTTNRPFREQWLTLMGLVGIKLPKYTLPALKPKPILTNDEALHNTFKPQLSTKSTHIKIKELKPVIYKPVYTPEAGVLIQNTQNIQEIYIDTMASPVNKRKLNEEAFVKTINSKFGDLTKSSDFATINFSTRKYFDEALRLSLNPQSYINEKINPIQKFIPASYDFIYNQVEKEEESPKGSNINIDSTGKLERDEEASVQPNFGSKRMTPISQSEALLRSRSPKSYLKTTVTQSLSLQPNRNVKLSSSLRPKKEITTDKEGRPIFKSSFKGPDNFTIRARIAKAEPILDPYTPPTDHVFRDDLPPLNKPVFVLGWKKEIPKIYDESLQNDYRSRELLEKERIKQEREYEAYLKRRNPHPWISTFKPASKEQGFVDHKYPEFLEKGEYVDGIRQLTSFIREEPEYDVPFKLFHRPLKKTDKTLTLSNLRPSKI